MEAERRLENQNWMYQISKLVRAGQASEFRIVRGDGPPTILATGVPAAGDGFPTDYYARAMAAVPELLAALRSADAAFATINIGRDHGLTPQGLWAMREAWHDVLNALAWATDSVADRAMLQGLAELTQEVPPVPRIDIHVEGGVIHDVKIDRGLRVRVDVIDYDVEGAEPADVETLSDGSEAVVSRYGCVQPETESHATEPKPAPVTIDWSCERCDWTEIGTYATVDDLLTSLSVSGWPICSECGRDCLYDLHESETESHAT